MGQTTVPATFVGTVSRASVDRALLDTGAVHSQITQEIANTIGVIDLGWSEPIPLFGGERRPLHFVAIPGVVLFGRDTHDYGLGFVFAALGDIPIIGAEVMEQLGVEVAPAKRTARVSASRLKKP